MSDIAIRVENVCKRFRLGEGQGFDNVREAVAHAATAPLRWFRPRPLTPDARPLTPDSGGGGDRDELWALRDVSFEVKRGEVLGIIGRNGAGKSTLLKILSRITEPTSGHIDIFGRVASLLEVGTGFHQDLTGRENIYLNGAILGMSRAEIKSKFDEIVAFAGVERFIDTPVKRYSSGMGVRLGFAVAAHLEPEILIVDEVLAVGDAEFQRKCLGKMDDVARSGRTVLFVSHNMAAVESLCSRCLLLSQGTRTADGAPADIIETYQGLGDHETSGVVELVGHAGRSRNSQPLMLRGRLLSATEQPTTLVQMGDDLTVEVEFTDAGRPIRPVLGLVVKTSTRVPIFGIDNRVVAGYRFTPMHEGGVIRCCVPDLPLMPGRYVIDLFLGDESRSLDRIQDALAFDVTATDFFGTGKLPPARCGALAIHARWSVAPASAAAEWSVTQ